MPEYIAKATLLHEGKVLHEESRLQLSEDKAERLGDKVERVEDPTQGKHDEKSFRKLGAEEQKVVVEKLNGDLEEHSNEDKRWAFVEQNQ